MKIVRSMKWNGKRVGLQDVLFQHPNTLSGGELQRLALMRTLALSPSLLLLDEFTSNLDNESVMLMEKQSMMQRNVVLQ